MTKLGQKWANLCTFRQEQDKYGSFFPNISTNGQKTWNVSNTIERHAFYWVILGGSNPNFSKNWCEGWQSYTFWSTFDQNSLGFSSKFDQNQESKYFRFGIKICAWAKLLLYFNVLYIIAYSTYFRCTVDRGLRETVTYRNALGFFPDLGIEMVRAPPLRATETTVT